MLSLDFSKGAQLQQMELIFSNYKKMEKNAKMAEMSYEFLILPCKNCFISTSQEPNLTK